MKILILGGSGFIGLNLAKQLNAKICKVAKGNVDINHLVIILSYKTWSSFSKRRREIVVYTKRENDQKICR